MVVNVKFFMCLWITVRNCLSLWSYAVNANFVVVVVVASMGLFYHIVILFLPCAVIFLSFSRKL